MSGGRRYVTSEPLAELMIGELGPPELSGDAMPLDRRADACVLTWFLTSHQLEATRVRHYMPQRRCRGGTAVAHAISSSEFIIAGLGVTTDPFSGT
nr:hypothetical protein CFP56_64562 [Quercus suber]